MHFPRRVAATCLLALTLAALLISHADARNDSSEPVFGPRVYKRTAGPPNTYEDTFTIPASIRGPYVLRLVNGDPKGAHRISSATVTLNGVELLKPKDFSPKVGTIERTIELKPSNLLRVSLTSGPDDYLTITVLGAAVPVPPLRLTPDPLSLVAGANGALTATLTPAPTAAGRLSVTSATPRVATVPATVSFQAGQSTVTIPVTGVAAGSSVVTVAIGGDRREDDRGDGRDDRRDRNERDRGGSNDPPVKASATVIVTAPPPPVNRAPSANAGGPYAGQTNQAITFAGSGSDPDNDPLTFTWAFGDGAGGSGVSPTHAYATAGPYTATLTVNDGRGGITTSTASVSITTPPPPPPVNHPPTANAGGPYAAETGQAVTFAGSGSDPDNDPLTFTWDFGDGASGTGASLTHAYAIAGPYTATLTVNDGRGGITTSTASVSITTTPPPPPVNHPPTANAGGPYAAQTDQTVAFAGSGSDPDNDPLTFTWDFGDGASGTGTSPTHAYAIAGPYSATLTVNDGRGGITTSTASVSITTTPPPPPVNHPPTANAGGPYAAQTDQTVAFAGSGSDPDNDPLTFTWDFGEGANGIGASPTHVYGAAGTYTATLTVNDGRGGITTSTASVSITTTPPPPPVNHPPTANAGGPYAAQTDQTVAFAGSGSDPDNDPLTFTWDFGEGANGIGASPTHVYGAAGTYTATLTVNDGRGGITTSTASVSITTTPPPPPVNHPPTANAGGPYAAQTDQTVAFAGSGSDPDNDPLTFTWDFGDGASGTGTSPTHAYAIAGPYTATLTVNDGRGGITTSTASVSITTTPPPVNHPPTITTSPLLSGAHQHAYAYQAAASDPDGDAVVFSLSSAPAGMTVGASTGLVAWTPGAGQLGANAVTLVATDSHGAPAAQSFNVTVVDATSPVVSLSLPVEVLPGTTVTATAQATDDIGVVSVRFDVNGANGTDLAAAPFQHLLVVPANAVTGTEFHVRATARDAAGNTGWADRTFRIAATPDVQPPALILNVPGQASPGSIVYLSATAGDNVGVKSVVFRAGGVVIATDTAAPYEAVFTVPADLPVGTAVDFAARVFDFSDNFTDATGALHVVATPDTTPPTVQVVLAPSVAEGATATLAATAADNVGVASVAFFVNGVNVGVSATAPYQTVFPLPPDITGNAVLSVEARALDFSGLVASSTGTIAVLANPNRTPTANAGGPYSGEVGERIRFSAAASSDPDSGDHLSYDWDFGDQTTGSGLSPSHAYLAEGAFVVTVTVSDGRGGVATSQANVQASVPTDRNAPAISLNGPASVLPGRQVTMTALATDDRGISGVAFEVNGGAPIDVAGPPYQRVIDVPPVASPGDLITVRATARDAAGNRTSAERSLAIGSAPDTEVPSVSINAPPNTVAGTTLQLSATASDNVGVQSVSFTVNGVVVKTLAGPPFEAVYPVPADATAGSSIGVVVQANDFDGNHAEASRLVTVVALAEGDTTPPTVSLTAPLQVFEGQAVSLSAQAQDNVGVSSVRFFVNGVNVDTRTAPPFSFTYSLPASVLGGAVLALRADAVDLSGLSASAAAQTLVVSSASAGQGVIAGEVYDDGAGLPLAGATVRLIGTDNTGTAYTASAISDDRGQWVLRAAEGHGVVTITRPGWTRIDRPTAIVVNQALELIDARLTLLAPATSVSAVLGGAVSAPSGPGPQSQLTVPPGALQTATNIALTLLTQQGIEGPLPAGWSPVAMADIAAHDTAFALPATLSIANGFQVAAGTALTAVKWDEPASAWRAIGSLVAPANGPLAIEVSQGGQYAVVKPDTAPALPPPAVIGEPIEGIALSTLDVNAATIVDPQPRVIFYRPGVRSDVRGTIAASTPISSGLPIEARIIESYSFLNGTNVRPESFVEDLAFYQVGGPASGLAALFAVTPSRTFDPLALQQGVITVELMAPSFGPRVASTFGSNGGVASAASGEALQVPPGAVAESLPFSVRGLSAANYGVTMPPGIDVAGATLVGFPGTLERAAGLSVPKPAALPAQARLLLVRAQEINGETRLVLVGRGLIVGDRIVSDTTLNGSDVFEGVRVGGRYFFVTLAGGFGFAQGQVLAAAGGPASGAIVSASGFPILSLSRSTGAYVAGASVGAVALTALDSVNADTGTAAGELASVGAVLPLDLQIVLSVPRVTAVVPADGSANVALNDPIVVRFSKGIAPASINGANAGNVRLMSQDGAAVSASISLSASSAVTLRPASALASNTVYTVVVTTGVTDVAGRSLASDVTTQFTSLDTQPPPMPAAGSISAAIPGTDGFTTISATQGTAATHDTVTVVNLTRRTTSPVLLDPNGGFIVRVAASLTDKLQIAITDANGNQTVVPIARFTRTNADGSVSVFVGADGGRVEGAGGTAVDVFAGTFPDGAVVTVKPVTEASFPMQLAPTNRAVLSYAGGFELDFGGAIPTRYVNVSVAPSPVDTPDNQWLVGQVVDRNGQLMLNMVDTAKLIDARVTTSSPPCPGVTAAGIYGIYKSNRRVGLTFGAMATHQTVGEMVAKTDSFGDDFAAWSSGQDVNTLVVTPVCLPVLSGRVTVTLNTANIKIPASEIRDSDQEIVITRVDTTTFPATRTESRFNRDDLSYSLIVAGTITDPFSVVAASPAVSRTVAFKVAPDSPGFVKIDLALDAITSAVSEVVVSNGPASLTTFPVGTINTLAVVAGGSGDSFEVKARGPATDRSISLFSKLPSTFGADPLLLRALPGTIDPTHAEVDAYNAAHPLDPIVTTRYRDRVSLLNLTLDTQTEVPAALIVNGGFAWAFAGNLSQNFRVEVHYVGGEVDYIDIPVFRVTVSTAAGVPVKTIVLPAPPRDVVVELDLETDTILPVLTTPLWSLQNFDPARVLTIDFDEPIDRASILANFKLLDLAGLPVAGQIRVSNGNKSVTFVPANGLAFGENYTVRLAGLRDAAGNLLDPSRHYLALKTLGPRKIGELTSGAGSPARPIEGLRDLQILRKTVGGAAQTTLVAVTDAASGVGYKVLTIDVTNPRAPVEAGRESGGASKQQLTVVPGVHLDLAGENPCTPLSHEFDGDLGVTTTFNLLFSFVSFYDVTNRSHPCMLGNKLLTANPETLSDFSRHGTIHTLGFAKGVATIAYEPTTQEPGGGIMAYTAVSEVGIMATRAGLNIPEILPASRPLDPILPGDYVDVTAASNRLVALNRGTQQLEIVDPSLAVLATVDLPEPPSRLRYVPRLPFDVNGDGSIVTGEYIDAALVSGNKSVMVVDLTNVASPVFLRSISLPSQVRDIDVDRQRLRLFVATDTAWHIVDLAKYQITWTQNFACSWSLRNPCTLYTVRIDTETNNLYVGTGESLQVWDFGPPGLSGVATFTYFPVNPTSGIDYGNLQRKPIRGAIVELRNVGGSAATLVATTNTDENGYYSFDAPVGATLAVVVKAALGKPGAETVKVIDNTHGDSVWWKSSGSFVMPSSLGMDVYAETQFSPVLMPASSYAVRDAAPFAILDMAYLAQKKIRSAAPNAVFPLLKMAWSPDNRPNLPGQTGTNNNPAIGQIGTSNYSSADGTLYVLGAENVDSDEYDSQVVLHEWSHYFEDKFSKSDSIGDEHRPQDILDPRVAFGEGFATAFAGMLTGDRNYVDTTGNYQTGTSLTDAERDSTFSHGFFSEYTVIELLWDLFDGVDLEVDTDASGPGRVTLVHDDVELEFGAIYKAMVNGQKKTNAFTTIFSFLHTLKTTYQATPVWGNIVTLAQAENIDLANADEFELFNNSTITGLPLVTALVGGVPVVVNVDVPIGRLYTVVPPNGSTVSEASTGPYSVPTVQLLQTRLTFDPLGEGNKLYDQVFFKIPISTAGWYQVVVEPTLTTTALFVAVKHDGTTTASGTTYQPGNPQAVTVHLNPGTYVAAVDAWLLSGAKYWPTNATFKIMAFSVPPPP